MHFNDHSGLAGRHAFLSPSKSHWLRYTPEQLTGRFHSWLASKRGTDLHNLAHEAIRLGVLLDSSNEALAAYVADALAFGMSCEVALYYSDNCFGHADTLSFDGALLRIHDLKTGITPSKMEQLRVYAALFCLEYGINPDDIDIELRIYQREEEFGQQDNPGPGEIMAVMTKIVEQDQYIESLRG